MILCANPQANYLAHKEEIDEVMRIVAAKGWYVLGEEVKAFEAEFARYIGVGHGVGVGSGTEALHLALASAGIGPGDEVITVSHTAVATVAAIELAGATPVLADIEPDFYTIAPEKIERLVTSRTKAIVPVHIYGQPADMAPILEMATRHRLTVIEDCAQAHGASYRGQRVGTFGEIACFSFYPTKNLGALGDGGMLVTCDPEVARRARLIREYGWAERYVSHLRGWNSRLDEIQAAILRIKLRSLDKDNARRAELAGAYDARLCGSGIVLPSVRKDATHARHLYVIRTPRRDELQVFLRDNGISALIHYPVPVHLQPAYRGRLAGGDDLHETEKAAGEILSLPLYPELPKPDLERVADAVLSFVAGVRHG